ncbi:helix-turn-helix transcriptional regulator [Cohnella lupini]|uniref:AraC-like DNA-binding protein n=1 Tax=Cohnella lupini TaxID=1294267 RepID=A0A3D9IJB4_9BACL|nr:AraC family transcriptional regulator [Cohnella lupini]RED61884.1 AraC-like DNA-binding protein [Cohnella lupini]
MYEHRYREISAHGLPDFPFDVYTNEHHQNKHAILPIHWHNEMEMIYLVKGSALFKIENRDYSLRAGEAVIVHPGELHSGIRTESGEVVYHSIVFRFSWLSSFQKDRIQEQFIFPILDGTIRFPAFLSPDKREHDKPLEFIRNILMENERKAYAYEMNLKAYLIGLIAHLYQNDLMESRIEIKSRQGRELHHKMKSLLSFMDKNLNNKLELNQLASTINLSSSHFCRFFKDQTGMRPMEYLNYIRVNKAATLLRTGTYSVIDAAFETGYQHISYFSKWFKIYMSMTPSEYKAYYASGI